MPSNPISALFAATKSEIVTPVANAPITGIAKTKSKPMRIPVARDAIVT